MDFGTVGLQPFTSWQDVLTKADNTGVDPSSLTVGSDGLVYGNDPILGLSVLGTWAGPAQPAAAAAGGSIAGIPIWLLALLAIGALIIIRKL